MSLYERPGMSDEWYTPKYVFDALGVTFDLDVASPKDRKFCHVPAINYLTEKSLETEWKGFVWMNPPFGARGSKEAWLDKMSAHGNGIALTPDRTSAPWWVKAAYESDVIFFITPGKVQFIQSDGIVGSKPSNGVTLFGYGRQAMQALINAEKSGLGILLCRC